MTHVAGRLDGIPSDRAFAVDPDTGRPSFDPLHVLNRVRGHLVTTEPLPFGVWADVLEPGDVALGDPVQVVGS